MKRDAGNRRGRRTNRDEDAVFEGAAPAQVRHVPEASPAPRPSAEEVARDPDIPKRIAQIQDPEQRAKAQTLLKEVRAEVAARESSNQPSKDKGEGLEP